MAPTPTSPTPTARQRAEAIYAEALAAAGPSVGIDLAALYRRAPELALELHTIHDEWQRVRGVHAALAEAQSAKRAAEHAVAPPTIEQRLRQRYGAQLAHGLSLDPKPPVGAETIQGRMLERLGEHAPRHSRYELVEEIGRGGMGAVYKVWDPDLRRTLAMKVVLALHEGAASDASSDEEHKPLSRFLEEAQVTGQLDHPGIVPVHELGLDPDGRVYFTMRLVKGRDLLKIFELVRDGKEGWTQTRALGALLKACEAMAYAHDKRVIHRDLKPANVMVGQFGEVYVMDWGLARVLGQHDHKDVRPRARPAAPLTLVRTERHAAREEAGDSPLMTMDGDILGTPAYMSPEQARGDVEKLDARTDVYSAGAILYHLLAGHMPYVPPGADIGPVAVWGLVQAGAPEALAKVAPQAPVELVAIAEKAMARDPAARYPSMRELVEDLRSFLEGRVVHAYEKGAAAELRKWVRRNRATALASAAAIVLLVTGLGVVTFVQTRANARLGEKNAALAVATDEARRERDAGVVVNEFLVGLFESPDPRRARGETITAKQLLDRGALAIVDRGDTDPLVWARLRDSMGQAYSSLGLYADARPLLEGALADRRKALGEEHPDTLVSRNRLARLARAQGRYDEADELGAGALEIERRVLGADAPATLATLGELGLLRYNQARYPEAEELLQQALDGRARVLGPRHTDTLRSHVDLALLYRKQARYDDARRLLEAALAGYRDAKLEDVPDALKTLNDLAGVELLQRHFAAARPLYERALENRRRVLGPLHPDTLTTQNDLAYLHVLSGQDALAEPLYAEALAGCRTALGEDHPLRLALLTNLAALYQRQNRPVEAEPLFLEAVERTQRTLGADHPNSLAAQNGLAYLYFSTQRYAESEPLYQKALEAHRRVLGADHPNTLTILFNLASLFRAEQRWNDAEPLVRELLLRTPRADAEYAPRQQLFDAVNEALKPR